MFSLIVILLKSSCDSILYASHPAIYLFDSYELLTLSTCSISHQISTCLRTVDKVLPPTLVLCHCLFIVKMLPLAIKLYTLSAYISKSQLGQSSTMPVFVRTTFWIICAACRDFSLIHFKWSARCTSWFSKQPVLNATVQHKLSERAF